MGSNVEEVVWKNIHFVMWLVWFLFILRVNSIFCELKRDIGGQEALRSAWSTYFTNAQVILFLVEILNIFH